MKGILRIQSVIDWYSFEEKPAHTGQCFVCFATRDGKLKMALSVWTGDYFISLQSADIRAWGYAPEPVDCSAQELDDDDRCEIQCLKDTSVPEDSECAKCCIHCETRDTCEWVCENIRNGWTEEKIRKECQAAI